MKKRLRAQVSGKKIGKILDMIISQEQAIKLKEEHGESPKHRTVEEAREAKKSPKTYEELMAATKKRMKELNI